MASSYLFSDCPGSMQVLMVAPTLLPSQALELCVPLQARLLSVVTGVAQAHPLLHWGNTWLALFRASTREIEITGEAPESQDVYAGREVPALRAALNGSA